MYNRSESKTQQAYELDHDFFDRYEDYGEGEHEFDAEVIKPKRYGRSIDQYFWEPEPITEFNCIEIEGILELMQGIDYLFTKPKLPIMSRRMLYILNSVGEFPHQVIPVSIKDAEIPIYNHKTGQPSGKVNNTDYVAVHMLEESNFFDYEKSIYERSEQFPGTLDYIDLMVLKEPSAGFPPLFKIPEDSLELYISPQAKLALEEAEITGIRFVGLRGCYY